MFVSLSASSGDGRILPRTGSYSNKHNAPYFLVIFHWLNEELSQELAENAENKDYPAPRSPVFLYLLNRRSATTLGFS